MGLAPEQIRRVIKEEWRRHGLDPPKRIVMDRLVDEITRPPNLVERLETKMRLGEDLIGLPLRIRRATRGGIGQKMLDKALSERGRVYEVATGDEHIAVEMNPNAVTDIQRLVAKAVFLPSFVTATKVEIRMGDFGQVEVYPFISPDELAASAPLGRVPESESARLQALIQIAQRVRQPCVIRAFLVRARDGGWQVLLPRPLKPEPHENVSQ
jgi:hypothetical protein